MNLVLLNVYRKKESVGSISKDWGKVTGESVAAMSFTSVPDIEQWLKQDIPCTAYRLKDQTNSHPPNFSSSTTVLSLVVVVNWQLPTHTESLTFLCCDWSTQIYTHTKKRAPLKKWNFSQLQKSCQLERGTILQTHPQLLYISSSPLLFYFSTKQRAVISRCSCTYSTCMLQYACTSVTTLKRQKLL